MLPIQGARFASGLKTCPVPAMLDVIFTPAPVTNDTIRLLAYNHRQLGDIRRDPPQPHRAKGRAYAGCTQGAASISSAPYLHKPRQTDPAAIRLSFHRAIAATIAEVDIQGAL